MDDMSEQICAVQGVQQWSQADRPVQCTNRPAASDRAARQTAGRSGQQSQDEAALPKTNTHRVMTHVDV